MYADISYNLFVKRLPEEVKLERIAEVVSEKLRSLPIKAQYSDPYAGIATMEYSGDKTKKVLHKGGKKRFWSIQSRLTRKIRRNPLIISILL